MRLITSMNLGSIFDLGLDRHISTRELIEGIEQKRKKYFSMGLRRGDKAIIAHGNNYLFFMDLFALWELGVCAIPIDPTTSNSELARLIEHSDAKIVIYKEESSNHKELLNVGESEQSEQEQLMQWEDAALMLYTSGTTGQPKGVLHTFRSLFTRLYSLKPYVPVEALRKSLCLLPSHFGHGLICNSLYPLLNGCDLYVSPTFNMSIVSNLGETIDRHSITFMSSVPTIWQMALKFSEPPKNKTLQRIHCGSAPLSAALWQNIKEWSGATTVKNTYGITETGSWLAGSEDGVENFVDGYVGKGWGTQIFISSGAENNFQAAKPGEAGDVWVQTPALMKGYYKRDDLTNEVVRSGWFNTGDIGYLDASGGLVLVGRKRHEINRAGMKVYPEDVDLVLMKHPGVADACAFAVPDAVAGQLVGAAVVINKNSPTQLSDIEAWCRSHLANYKVPSKWYVLDEVPRTSRGKINRENVAKKCFEI